MESHLFKTVAEVATVIVGFILAFMVYQKIDPGKIIKPDSAQMAGEDIPRLSGGDEFEALVGTDSVTAEPEEVVATGVYGLKLWVDSYNLLTIRFKVINIPIMS